ncbi:MAG: LysR family transcriptional regulator [Mixta calida]|jgi:DNA-binding transcriptional LysR family regulator|uniref:LysR family transcriptional regulator n=1 Tax=Mixta calida TaxID=665913 RepID=A0ABM6RYK7_9GAMM|nr:MULTISPECIES: LysR family transcriptional regulator [Mixta]AIX75478.1 transcriptional regulator [Pantoea sp. PSNIH2]MBS6058550.1 LysR family transcriptional regulator [Pantoea sp.]POU49844.1 LysR family transcriptional regulator [Pantoea sp. PSNIH5]POU69326.1 LysR family transcriptional regulator [Pantoea sp. PSNIH4]POY65763.1 LysR family transcriptional regulator [Pantoea sp. PSNIH3]HCW47767.1 LysR family transcriptional regulator [Erwiniaceae bacterium]
MDKIHAMKVFVTVAEMESFTRAAESLGQPKGSLSRQIQALEDRMGARLLHRTTRRVQLTQDGLVYYERCRDVLATLEEMDTLFQKEPATLSGRLRVDMPVALATDIIIPQLPQFLQHYPGLELELSSSDRQVDVIREGFDCVVRIGQLQDSGLMSRTLGHLPMINCASPDYLMRFGMPLRLEDLSQHAMVHYSQQLGSAHSGFEFFDGQRSHFIQTGGALTVNSTPAYRHACLAGLGIIQVPRHGVQALLENQRLVEVLPHFCARPMPLSLLWPHRRNLAQRVRVFMEWLTQAMKGTIT